MKIAITGAHQTGKTTLARRLEVLLPGYHFVAEPYHLLAEEGHLFSEIPTTEDYLLQLEYSIDQVSESEGNLIFDRCPVDFLAYLHASDEMQDLDLPELYQQVEVVMPEIDLLIFVPIENPDVIGGLDSDLPELRAQVDELLNEWVWDFGVEVVEVSGDVEQRGQQVMESIHSL